MTPKSATKPNRRIHRLGSFQKRMITRPIVSKPTDVATIRWPCSQNRFPTIAGKNCPLERGQSSVASPASLLVTSAPAMIRKNVAPATSKENQWRPLFTSYNSLLLSLAIADFQLPIFTYCRLPIANCRFVRGKPQDINPLEIGNRKSAVGNLALVSSDHWDLERRHHLKSGWP